MPHGPPVCHQFCSEDSHLQNSSTVPQYQCPAAPYACLDAFSSLSVHCVVLFSSTQMILRKKEKRREKNQRSSCQVCGPQPNDISLTRKAEKQIEDWHKLGAN